MLRRLALSVTLLLSVIAVYAQAKWVEGRALTVEGRAAEGEREHFYDRLPYNAKQNVRSELWSLSQHSAGMCIRFSTDSKNISVRWKLRFSAGMPHLTGCVTNGIDLYAFDDGSEKWRWAGIVKPYKHPENSGSLLSNLPPQMRSYQLYLPCYNGVDSVFIGIDDDAEIYPLNRNNSKLPLVFYGTSITQGASASRTGLTATAILGRYFDVETVNLGFSGNGRMEEAIAEVMLNTAASCYIIDCLPNMTAEMVGERTVPFIEQLRSSKISTPILLVECTHNDADWINQTEHHRIQEKNTALKKAYNQLLANGYTNLYYLPGALLIGNDSEASVDGVHYNDTGFTRYAEQLKALLEVILQQ